jgi:2-keto-4-pentenoate hydratase/2-oxohepta-3-ene-1,7-dioic acid hydratase in catechol pathway
MRLCRFNDDKLGLIVGDTVRDVSAALEILPQVRWPAPLGDPLVAHLAELRTRIAQIGAEAPALKVADISLHSPVANPGKIMAAPANYRLHVEQDTKDPTIDAGVHRAQLLDMEAPTEKLGLFLKANSSLVGPAEGIVIPPHVDRVDYEVELVVVVGKQGRNIAQVDALSFIAGYCIGLDMTIRGIADRSFRKSGDTFTVLGPWLVTADEISNPGNLELSLTVGSEVRQRSNTAAMTVGIERMIEIASANYTLHPGDVLLTGTPEGVGPVSVGDTIVAHCDGIGEMRVPVRGGSIPARGRRDER